MRKNGFSLIELLIAITLSTLAVLMMLMVFKQVTRVSIEVTQDSDYDAQLETGVLILQKLVQNAGYGNGEFDDIVEGSFQGKSAIFWRFVTDLDEEPLSYECQGAVELTTEENSLFNHRLTLLRPKSGTCNAASELESLEWIPINIISTLKSEFEDEIFLYDLAGACKPYGIQDIEGLRQLTITGRRLNIADGLGRTIQRAVCLSNISAL